MRRSSEIVLVLITTTSLTACGPDYQKTKRDIYATQEKCVEEWTDRNVCEKQPGSGVWYGPHFYHSSGVPYYYRPGSKDPVAVQGQSRFASASPNEASPKSSGIFSSSHITRGGFGRLASFHGSGS